MELRKELAKAVALHANGWHVLTIWERETKAKNGLERRLHLYFGLDER